MQNKDLKQIIITEEQLKIRAKEIGALIDKKYEGKEITLVGLLKGSYVFTADVARAISNPNTKVEFMVVSSYKNGASVGVVTINLDLKESPKGKNIIIIEDIVDSGRTLAKIKQMFIERGANSVEIAAMCTKPSRREEHVDLDYPTFEIPNEIVVGYGLDYNEMYRHLPYVAAISEKALGKYKK